MKEVDESCPLGGAKDFTKDVTLPKEIPSVSGNAITGRGATGTNRLLQGTYTVLADVYTKEAKQVTCLKATVHFS